MFGKVSVFGLGYVGLTTAACLAYKKFNVTGFDVDLEKVSAINKGKVYVHEPGLEKLVEETVTEGFLKATSNPKQTINKTEITFITVGTPSKPDGSIDLTAVKEVSKTIGEALHDKKGWHLVVVKSTVIPGTTENMVKPILEETSGKKCGTDFGLCVNPEFLREGNAVEDMFKPDKLVIGEFDKKSGDALENFYRMFYENQLPPTIRTTPVNAELIKYANNAFLAMKVSFINMVANLCQKLPGADVEIVAKGIGLDKRIGSLFLRAGLGWGGSCWPKDLQAFLNFSSKMEVPLPLVKATLDINSLQPYVAVKLAEKFLGSLQGKKVALLGLAFKPNTDDMREAVSIKLVEKLLQLEAEVVVYDPIALGNAKKIFGEKVRYANSVQECLNGAECCIIVTEWEEFKKLKPDDFLKHMKNPVVIDGRRIYKPEEFNRKLKFAAIGLGTYNQKG
ncbi:UDP-glucose 6-dehydrogenase [Candidatus Bathyarchaeota archaeon]|nr:MAG: UDP-glucose 6-dehydrogenase [Candidatus Bathyarchaeota archaeon]